VWGTVLVLTVGLPLERRMGTATMPTLWRRRIRLVIFAVLMLLALFSGGFADLVRLGAAVTGAFLGPVLLGRPPRLGRPVSSRHEGRVLIALLVAVLAIGPVVAGLVPHAAGPLFVLRFLFTNIQPVDPQTLQGLCTDPAQAKDCAGAQLQMRAGAGGSSWRSFRRFCCCCSRTVFAADAASPGRPPC
jgi:phosphatidylglycerol lysyltransferase